MRLLALENAEARERRVLEIFGTFIDLVTWADALARIFLWAEARESKVVSICNAHSVVTAGRDPEFAEVLRASDLATPDGMPLAWVARALGHSEQERINGPDLMWRYCSIAAQNEQPMFLYGGSDECLSTLKAKLDSAFPGIRIAGMYAPPYRALTQAEDEEVVERINASGARVVWVALGCPKQEKWMHRHRGRVRGVMVGVGAAFDYHAGTLKRAPLWMQSSGLEWLFRLFMEPRRLWRRYLVTNTLFIAGAAKQILKRVCRL